LLRSGTESLPLASLALKVLAAVARISGVRVRRMLAHALVEVDAVLVAVEGVVDAEVATIGAAGHDNSFPTMREHL